MIPTEWNTISVEWTRGVGFALEVNGEREIFHGRLPKNNMNLRIGVQDSGNMFTGQIRLFSLQQGEGELLLPSWRQHPPPPPPQDSPSPHNTVDYDMRTGFGSHRDTASTSFVCSGMDLSPMVGPHLEKVIFCAPRKHDKSKHIVFLLYERLSSPDGENETETDGYALRWVGHTMSGRQEYVVKGDVPAVIKSSSYKLGWKDGTTTTANSGSISWTEGTRRENSGCVAE